MKRKNNYSYGPSAKGNGLNRSDFIGIALLLIVFIVLAVVGYWVWSTKSKTIEYDRNTYCPKDGPFGKTVLLIDLTDEVSFLQEQKLRNFVNTLGDADSQISVAKNEMLEIYLLSESYADELPLPLVQACNPGDGKGLSEFTANPRLAKLRFIQSFKEPIDEALRQIVSMSGAKTSPLVEAIRGISVKSFSKPASDGYTNRLVVISDMLQNTRKLSHYRGDQSAYADKLSPNKASMSNVDLVDIKVINRNSNKSLQGKGLIKF
jgi:hypothetical protein